MDLLKSRLSYKEKRQLLNRLRAVAREFDQMHLANQAFEDIGINSSWSYYGPGQYELTTGTGHLYTVRAQGSRWVMTIRHDLELLFDRLSQAFSHVLTQTKKGEFE